MARRGYVKTIRCDNGTNFVGASRELNKCLAEVNKGVEASLKQRGIQWIFNPPGASKWERQIRTIRRILASVLSEFPDWMDDETLRTLFCEVEGIVNSQPLTTLSDNPDDLNPLTPNHVLGIESGFIVPPPGIFQREDAHLRQRWRRVQHFANVFWKRWSQEFLMSLQERIKWNGTKRIMQVRDVTN